MKYFAFFVLGFCLLGCTAPKLHQFSVDTFQNQTPVQMKVKEIVISNQVAQFDKLPHIENEMPITPKNVLEDWAKNRFYPVNSSKKADVMQVVIEKAYMTKKDEKSENWYTFDNEKYHLSYAVRVDFLLNKDVVYTLDVGGFESSSLPKRSSLSDKEKTFEKMMNQMVQKVNHQILLQMPPQMIVKGH